MQTPCSSSVALIDHFDLFGLRQVFLHLQGMQYADSGPHLGADGENDNG